MQYQKRTSSLRNVSQTKRDIATGRLYRPQEVGLWWLPEAGFEIEEQSKADDYRMLFHSPFNATPELREVESDNLVLAKAFLRLKRDNRWLRTVRAEINHLHGKVFSLRVEWALHRQFAKVPLDELGKGVLSFASKYGFLGRETLVLKQNGSRTGHLGETLEQWREEIIIVRVLLHVYDLLREEKRSEFSRWLELGSTARLSAIAIRSLYDMGPLPEALEVTAWIDPEGAPLTDRIAVERRALWTLLEQTLNFLISDGVSPAIELERGGQVFLNPRDLLGAIHTHLAMEIMGRTPPPIACKGCGSFFPAEHARREFCSPACRQKHYRNNKRAGAPNA